MQRIEPDKSYKYNNCIFWLTQTQDIQIIYLTDTGTFQLCPQVLFHGIATNDEHCYKSKKDESADTALQLSN